MRTYICLLLLIALTIGGCAGSTTAVSPSKPRTGASAQQSNIGVRHAGNVVSVSNDAIVLRYGGNDHSFRITEKTRLLVPLAQLKPGDQASVLTLLADERIAVEVKGGLIEFRLDGGQLSPVR